MAQNTLSHCGYGFMYGLIAGAAPIGIVYKSTRKGFESLGANALRDELLPEHIDPDRNAYRRCKTAGAAAGLASNLALAGMPQAACLTAEVFITLERRRERRRERLDNIVG